ncbi:MAG: 2-hydroxychromene-2-carboxylate isomerase [Paracoccaceae bacterium]
MGTVTFYHSITSRYAYLASTQMAALADRTGCEIDWAPVDAAELRRLAQSEPFLGRPSSGQYRSPYREQDLADWVAYYDVPYREPPDDDGALWWQGFGWDKMRMLSRAALAGQELGGGAAFIHGLFHLMFVDTSWPFDKPEILSLAHRQGLDTTALGALMDTSALDARLTANARVACAAGAFGVPSFVYRGKLFFGNDRLVLLADHIAKTRRA